MTSTSDNTFSKVVKRWDEKKEEEELNMASSLDTLFEDYRIVEELAFDITKQEKTTQLNNLRKKIESVIDSIEQRYPYKQSLNLTTNNKNKPHKKDKKSGANKTENHTNKEKTNGVISRAQYLYFTGRYLTISGNDKDSALALLQESIKLDPSLIECWNTLGSIYYSCNELLASKFCFESALEHDRYNKISFMSLSKILRQPIMARNGRNVNEMEIMENCIQSLILAKQALKYSKNSKKNALKDGELWFNLGNAYLMTFLNCINGFKLESSIQLAKEQKVDKKEKEKAKEEKMDWLAGLDEAYFAEEYEKEEMYAAIRREIETELNDGSNNLLYHVYIKKCLSAYKCASTKCIINKHEHHPDLYCNRSHIHIYQENYDAALHDLKLSIKYSSIHDVDQFESESDDELSKAKQMHDGLLTKLCKISKQINAGQKMKMNKKLLSFSQQIKNHAAQCSDYYTSQLHYDLCNFNELNNGLNGGNVIVVKILQLIQQQNTNQLPLHFICCDGDVNNCNMFILSFYIRGHALNHILKIINQNQMNVINTQTLICVANPVKKLIKFNHGSKHIHFSTISHQKVQDICIGGKFFFNQ